MAKTQTESPPEEQPVPPVAPPVASPDIDEETMKALGMPVRIQTEQSDQPLVLTHTGVRGSRVPADPEPEQTAAAQEQVEVADAAARAAAAEQRLSDVPAEGQVRLTYQGDADTLSIGSHAFRPGQPVDVPREVAAQVLALRDQPFVVVSNPAEGATEEPSIEAAPPSDTGASPVAPAEEGPNA